MTHVRPLHHPARLVVRRNVPFRLAGAGYAAVTGGWLVAASGHAGEGFSAGTILFGLLTLTGVLFALLRDDLAFDPGGGTVRAMRGLPGFARTTTRRLGEFERVVVREENVGEYEEGEARPVRRAWFSVVLVGAQGESLPVMSVDSAAKAQRRAERLAGELGLPLIA